MGLIWQKIDAEFEALKQAGVPSYQLARRALTNMTKSEAISALNEAIETVKQHSDDIRAILGWQRDPDCTAQLAMNNKCMNRYQNEINMYNRMSDDRFKETFPTLVFGSIVSDLRSLKLARDTLVSRGMRYNPPR